MATYLPLMQNSDHANFARHAIPAMRIVAGFDQRDSSVRDVLTTRDVRALATSDQLANAAAVVLRICTEKLGGRK